jgi:hypothetical protein
MLKTAQWCSTVSRNPGRDPGCWPYPNLFPTWLSPTIGAGKDVTLGERITSGDDGAA